MPTKKTTGQAAPRDRRRRPSEPPEPDATVTPITPNTSRGRGKAAKAGVAEQAKPSAVHIPARLNSRLRALGRKTGWTNAMILVAAIEDCHDQLEQLLRPSTVGGKIFPQLSARPQMDTEEEKKPREGAGTKYAFSISMPQAAYDAFDNLCENLNTNRSRLATVALTEYLRRHGMLDDVDDESQTAK